MNLRDIIADAKARYESENPYDEGDQRSEAALEAVKAAGISRANWRFAVKQVLAAWDSTPTNAVALEVTYEEREAHKSAVREAQREAMIAALRAEENSRLAAKTTPEQATKQAQYDAQAKAESDAINARHAAKLAEETAHDSAVEEIISRVRESHPELLADGLRESDGWKVARINNPLCRVAGFRVARRVVISGHNTDGDSTSYDTGEVSFSTDWRLCPEWKKLSSAELSKILKNL